MFDKKTACIGAATPCVLLLCATLHATLHAAMPDAKLATEILNEAGVKRGLIVHVGCGDGTVTAALPRNDGCLVHGLTVDSETVERARAFLQQKGVYSPLAVDSFDGERLPYAAGAGHPDREGSGVVRVGGNRYVLVPPPLLPRKGH